MIRLHHHPISGHAHRVRLFLSLLDLPFELVHVDLMAAAHKRPEFLALNDFGQVPVLEDGEVTLADSNAILVYLAHRYDTAGRWLPRDAVGAAHVQRWLSVAAGQLLNGPGTARLNVLFQRPHDPRSHEVAHALFARMEAHLATRTFFAAPHATVADVALHTYTTHAPEGGVSLAAYPQVRAWLARVEALPGFVGMAPHPAAA